ncbi:PREDICTED: odorant receptor 4-like [Ceratosolen solmsi marchali]|uniref:Odorant receptor n=1 Tax=Ceratosolen solmsi marchali TaxID=326594 RepID=A0AAJ6YNV7_9HYME|nr:PREDICTED: odorant receptor 4-like [Ceratosolen solmsi marchali]
MEYEVKKYENYKNYIELMLIASGVWPTFCKHPYILRRSLSIISVFTSGFIFYCIVAFLVKNVNNINIVTGCLGLMIGFFTTFIKVCTLVIHEKHIRELNEGISTTFENDIKVPELQPHLLAHFRIFSKLFNIINFLLCISIFLLIIMPLLALRNNKYVRTYPQVLPFSYEPGGFIHWSIYAFEILGGLYLWTVTSGVDSVFGLYALHIVGELRVLGSAFQSLKFNTNYKKNLKKCIDKHFLLMQSRCKLQQVFSFLALWLAVTCAIAMCGIVFQATQTKNKSIVKLMYWTGHFVLKLVQGYSYAWYGNIISVESEICLYSIYKASWPGSGETCFMKDVLIILSQKPLIFIAKGCMSVRLDMFLKILHATISYFFLLQTLQQHPDLM